MPLDEIDEDKIIFYDIETDHQYAPYAKLKTIACQYGINGRPEMVVGRMARKEFLLKISSPEIIKVDFNGGNFDRIVLQRHGYVFNYQNAHDLFLGFKTINPNLPAFGQKFISFYFLSDPHFPEMELQAWMAEHDKPMYQAPYPLLAAYNKHDVVQLCNLFRIAWDVLIRPEYWAPYLRDLMMGEPLYEMETEGGIHLNREACRYALHSLQKTIQQQTNRALELTHGQVQNPNSSPQLGKYFNEIDKLELELTADDNFKVDKRFLLSIRDSNPLADCAFRIREANAEIKYFENFLTALDDNTYTATQSECWIPNQYSVSSARTRRFTSQSLYKLNFQNPSEEADAVVVVPKGFLGWWFDATQIENVVHIYESQDHIRRSAYESDPDWNEYVWLCNTINGCKRSKDEWDDRTQFPHPAVPHWSMYKGAKTTKLAINFGMGIAKYCEFNRVDEEIGRELFRIVNQACPAIKELQQRVGRDLRSGGFVEDVFGYRYSGPDEKAYKVMAYLIQGCGTGSLPKSQIRANWETLRSFDKYMPKSIKCGVMAVTTHDENGGRVNLQMGSEKILHLMQRLHFNMTEKFSSRFDDIPLRAKLYLSKTTATKAIECDIHDTNKILTIITGSPCPRCAATGKLENKKCTTCNGCGYISAKEIGN